jgi:hypothetical protein
MIEMELITTIEFKSVEDNYRKEVSGKRTVNGIRR